MRSVRTEPRAVLTAGDSRPALTLSTCSAQPPTHVIYVPPSPITVDDAVVLDSLPRLELDDAAVIVSRFRQPYFKSLQRDDATCASTGLPHWALLSLFARATRVPFASAFDESTTPSGPRGRTRSKCDRQYPMCLWTISGTFVLYLFTLYLDAAVK